MPNDQAAPSSATDELDRRPMGADEMADIEGCIRSPIWLEVAGGSQDVLWLLYRADRLLDEVKRLRQELDRMRCALIRAPGSDDIPQD